MTPSILYARGPEAVSFLQSQLTIDISKIGSRDWSWAGYCNPKGRLLATLILCPCDDGFFIVLDASVAENIEKRLLMYRMRAKVDVYQGSDLHFFCFIPSATDAGPEDAHSIFTHPNLPLRVAITSDSIKPSDNEGNRESERMRASGLALLRAGVPLLSASVSEQFIPQSVNLDLAGGVSFQKGCYPGQEIVARVRYRGKPKQRMVLISTKHPCPVTAGEKTSLTLDGQAVPAEIVATEHDAAADRSLVLASVSISAGDRLKNDQCAIDQNPCVIEDLPYPVPFEQ